MRSSLQTVLIGGLAAVTAFAIARAISCYGHASNRPSSQSDRIGAHAKGPRTVRLSYGTPSTSLRAVLESAHAVRPCSSWLASTVRSAWCCNADAQICSATRPCITPRERRSGAGVPARAIDPDRLASPAAERPSRAGRAESRPRANQARGRGNDVAGKGLIPCGNTCSHRLPNRAVILLAERRNCGARRRKLYAFTARHRGSVVLVRTVVPR